MRDPSQGLSAPTVTSPWDPAGPQDTPGGPILAWGWGSGIWSSGSSEGALGSKGEESGILGLEGQAGRWGGVGGRLRRGREGQPVGAGGGSRAGCTWGMPAPRGWGVPPGAGLGDLSEPGVQEGGGPHTGSCRSGEPGEAWRG